MVDDRRSSAMARRRIETVVARLTLVFVVVFAPLETIVSWKYGLLSPYYLVDVVAIVLLFVGAWRSLRARPRPAPALVTIGWAWAGANFWRAALARAEQLRAGGALEFGLAEMRAAVGVTIAATALVALGTWLIIHEHDAG